jgi:hypothetical protein
VKKGELEFMQRCEQRLRDSARLIREKRCDFPTGDWTFCGKNADTFVAGNPKTIAFADRWLCSEHARTWKDFRGMP